VADHDPGARPAMHVPTIQSGRPLSALEVVPEQRHLVGAHDAATSLLILARARQAAQAQAARAGAGAGASDWVPRVGGAAAGAVAPRTRAAAPTLQRTHPTTNKDQRTTAMGTNHPRPALRK
jgi:hypothetical protein